MFRQKLRLLLQLGLPFHAPTCRSVHRLASLQKVAALPSRTMQSLLYPFSGLEAYLDRCCVCGTVSSSLSGSSHVLHSSRSVDRTPFQLFHPSLEDMMEAEKLFRCSPSHRIEYVTSAERMAHAPALKAPEVSATSH